MADGQTLQSMLLARDVRLFPEPPTGFATRPTSISSQTGSDWSPDNNVVAKVPKNRPAKRNTSFYSWKNSFTKELDSLAPVKKLELLVQSLQIGLDNERKQRQHDANRFAKALQRVYDDFAAQSDRQQSRISSLDQVVNSIAGEHKGYKDELQSLKSMSDKMNDKVTTRLESIENQSLNMTPSLASNSFSCRPPSFKPNDRIWGVQVIFALSAARPNMIEAHDIPYLKLQSRRSSQYVFFSGDSSLSFCLGIEGSFSRILRGRPWMPLASQKLPDAKQPNRISLESISRADRDNSLWDHTFLQQTCIVQNKNGKDHLYIALQHDELSWQEIEAGLPIAGGRDSQLGVLDRIASQACGADEWSEKRESMGANGTAHRPNSVWKPRHRELLDSPPSHRSNFRRTSVDVRSFRENRFEENPVETQAQEQKQKRAWRASMGVQHHENSCRNKSSSRGIRDMLFKRGRRSNNNQ